MEFTFLGAEDESGWRTEWFGYGVDVDADGVRLRRDEVPTYRSPTLVFPPEDDQAGTAASRVVDVAVDGCGHPFVLLENGDVYRYDPDTGESHRLSCLWEDGPAEPTALAVTDETLYVASVVPDADAVGTQAATGRIHAYSRTLSQTRWVSTGPFVYPVAMAVADGIVYVLDVGTERVSAPAVPADPFLGRLANDGTGIPVLEDLTDPQDLAADDEGRLLVLDRLPAPAPDEHPRSRVRVFDRGTGDGPDGPTGAELSELPDGRLVRGNGADPFAVSEALPPVDARSLAAAGPGEIVVGVGPEFAGEHLLYRYLAREGGFERVPGFDRSAVRMALSPRRCDCDESGHEGGNHSDDGTPATRADLSTVESSAPTPRRLYIVDGEERSLYVLEQARANRRALGTDEPYSGRVVRRLDAGEPGTRWHRVVTDLTLDGPETQVRLHYHATDDETVELEGFRSIPGIGEVYDGRFREANVLGVRGLAELSSTTVEALVDSKPPDRPQDWVDAAIERAAAWRAYDHPNPRDGLLDAVGRYLWVELEIVGGEFTSPVVRSFRAYLPRQSYLRYLPGIYQEDEASAEFLEQYLSLFESVFVDVDEELRTFTRYLEPYGVPDEYVSWLGSWLATATDDELPAAVRRRLLEYAPALFKMRGTREGLLETLKLLLADRRRPQLDWDAVRERERRHLEGLVATGQLRPEEGTAAVEAAMDLYDRFARAGEYATTAEDPEPSPGPYDRELAAYLWTHADLECLDADAPDPSLLEVYRRLVGCPQCFLVLVGTPLEDARLRAIKRVVEADRPVHTVGRVAELRRELRLGGNAFLGVNTTLTEGEFVLKDSTLGADTVLAEREPYGQLGVRSRLGSDAELS